MGNLIHVMDLILGERSANMTNKKCVFVVLILETR